jgi:RNA polymerase sigma-70 factor (ECF subfamily)
LEAEQVMNAQQLQGMNMPEQELYNEEIIVEIKSAIDELPEEIRTTIILREF